MITVGAKRLGELADKHTQDVVAEEIGISQGAVSRYINGRTPPLWVANRLEKKYGIPQHDWGDGLADESGPLPACEEKESA